MTSRQQQFFASIPKSWQEPLEPVVNSPEIDNLLKFLKKRELEGAKIYPEKKNILAALKATPFNEVKVVIIGQDPYHGYGQAQGLSFSVPTGIAIPPSLRNIFKELYNDLGATGPIPTNGNLVGWAKQGVLLLNAILTVEDGKPASHANKGWEIFTDAIIEQLIKSGRPMVFMLWGAYAQKKAQNLSVHINPAIHLILKSAHPSPLSVTGFLGNHHFSQANQFLKTHGLTEINWLNI